MLIKLDDVYYLGSDERNYIIKKKNITQSGVNAGKEYFTDIAFALSLEHLLNIYLNLCVKQSDATSFSELVADILEIKKHINLILQDIENVTLED